MRRCLVRIVTWPMSRYEKIVVRSHNTYSRIRSSAATKPMAPAKPDGSGETRQCGRELAQTRLIVAEVAPAVEQHERTNTGDQQRHRPRQGVQAKCQVDIEPRIQVTLSV